MVLSSCHFGRVRTVVDGRRLGSQSATLSPASSAGKLRTLSSEQQDANLGDNVDYAGEAHWLWKGLRMDLALGDLANLVGGQLNGDAFIPISGAAIIRDANSGDITLADKAQLANQLAECRAAAVLV